MQLYIYILISDLKMFLHLPTRCVVQLSQNQMTEVLHENNPSAYFTSEGRIIENISQITSEHVFLHVKLVGGKGAFGSLLRFIGSQIEKTTNREAMRDLSGRRLHDVNNEQRLQEWNDRQAERERQREAEKEERLKKIREGPKHNFDDQKYFDQKNTIRDSLEDALNTALKNSEPQNDKPSSSKMNGQKSASKTPRKPMLKKSKGILDMGLPDGIDSDLSSSDESEDESKDKTPKSLTSNNVTDNKLDQCGAKTATFYKITGKQTSSEAESEEQSYDNTAKMTDNNENDGKLEKDSVDPNPNVSSGSRKRKPEIERRENQNQNEETSDSEPKKKRIDNN